MILNIFMYFVVLFLGLKRKDLQICGILFKDFEQKSSRRNLNVEKINIVDLILHYLGLKFIKFISYYKINSLNK